MSRIDFQIKKRQCFAYAAIAIAASAHAQGIQASVDGNLVVFPNVQPVMVNNHVLVPMRGVFGGMNTTLFWNGARRTVTAIHGNDTILLTQGSNFAYINENEIALDAPVLIRNGEILVPLRFISETLGASVEAGTRFGVRLTHDFSVGAVKGPQG